MCLGCYRDAGWPEPSEAAKALGPELAEIDPYGGCHIVIDDWNLDDDDIAFCMTYETTTDAERTVMAKLMALPEDQRFAAMAVADGYWPIDPRWR